MAEDLVVAFRTHRWNPDIAVLARRLAYYSQGVTFIVLADETAGALDTGHFRKLSHTKDFSGFGLPEFPSGSSLWYNGDYPLYLLRRAFPAATHFAMAEYDVAVNTDVTVILRDAQARGIDFIAEQFDPALPWYWWPTVTPHFTRPQRCFMPFAVVSARAIDALLEHRQAAFKAHPPVSREDWPFCEGFVPSVVTQMPDGAIEQLAHYARLPLFRFSFEQHLHDPDMNQAGTICHPVLGEAMLVSRRLVYEEAGAILDPRSALRRQLQFCDPRLFAPLLEAHIRAKGPPEMWHRYGALAAAKNWPAPERSAAPRGKKCLVIVRAGANSLHPAWLQGDELRNFDLVLCPYEDIATEPSAVWQTQTKPGQKWTGIYQLLTEWSGWRQYDYIWLPDDDLMTDSGTINRLFELSDAFNTTLSSPALTEDSDFLHVITMRNAQFFARATTFVEMMMPCLRRDVLELVLPGIARSRADGWGLDFVWPRKVQYQNIMIFDCIAVQHARPAGGTRDSALAREGNVDMSRLLADGDAPLLRKIIAAYAADGSLEATDSEAFLTKYIAGYRYLIERNPALIDDLRREQAMEVPLPPPLPNLALGRPALISSVWAALQPLDPATAAAGANNGKITREFGFHTEFEENPWWQVDLEAECLVERVAVYNRMDLRERCTRLSVSASADGAAWEVKGAKRDDTVFGGADGHPYIFYFYPPFKTRFVRLTMLGKGWLHLAEVEVLGHPVPAMLELVPQAAAKPGNIALRKPARMSSVAPGAMAQTPETAASAGNNGEITGTGGFRTADEPEPWWQVDLQAVHAIERVILFARLDAPEGCTRFSVSGALDAGDFHLMGVKLDAKPFGGVDGNPYMFEFNPAFAARFVRITLIGQNSLQLDEVEIYGAPA